MHRLWSGNTPQPQVHAQTQTQAQHDLCERYRAQREAFTQHMTGALENRVMFEHVCQALEDAPELQPHFRALKEAFDRRAADAETAKTALAETRAALVEAREEAHRAMREALVKSRRIDEVLALEAERGPDSETPQPHVDYSEIHGCALDTPDLYGDVLRTCCDAVPSYDWRLDVHHTPTA